MVQQSRSSKSFSVQAFREIFKAAPLVPLSQSFENEQSGQHVEIHISPHILDGFAPFPNRWGGCPKRQSRENQWTSTRIFDSSPFHVPKQTRSPASELLLNFSVWLLGYVCLSLHMFILVSLHGGPPVAHNSARCADCISNFQLTLRSPPQSGAMRFVDYTCKRRSK